MHFNSDEMKYPILQTSTVPVIEFVSFWQKLYDYGNEAIYYAIMAKSSWGADDITNLFLWKNNMGNRKENLAPTKKIFVNTVIAKLPLVNSLRENFNIELYINTFGKQSAVWGTTLLHAVSGASFPIYDQHVHRAYLYLCQLPDSKVPLYNPSRYQLYFEKYVPFFNQLRNAAEIQDPKILDNALWAFGRFLSLFPNMIDHRITGQNNISNKN
jgi:hypothetical protein